MLETPRRFWRNFISLLKDLIVSLSSGTSLVYTIFDTLSTIEFCVIIKTTKNTIMPKPRNAEHYVNNKEFLNALENYFAQVETAKLNDKPKPQIPRYIGECFLKIANHLSYKPNFVNYMFKDDMICDGIENCVRYVHNFSPEKSKNPFAYFTQIIYYAFLRRISQEKKQLEIKNKILERTDFDEVFDANDLDIGNFSEYNSIKDAVHQKLRGN